ncbi:hypothetical protein F4859DRAFT_237484 [Xylaria cf. heliscus]|nr:hypothetical protein F4859DRAFT_237484 [Xylaria cf. heliscus]
MRITTSSATLLAGAGIASGQFVSPHNGVYSFAVSSGPSELLGWNLVAVPREKIDQDSDAGFLDLVPSDSAPATEFSFYCPGSAYYIYCQMTGVVDDVSFGVYPYDGPVGLRRWWAGNAVMYDFWDGGVLHYNGALNNEPWVACPLEDGNYQLALYKYTEAPADCEVVVLGATRLS